MPRGYPDYWDPQRARTNIYQKTITTSKSTPSGSPKETTITLEKGVITRARIVFPYGCVGLLYVQIFHGTDQILPYSSGYLRGDGDRFRFDNFNYPLLTTPYEVIIKTWNDDDTYDHSVDILLEVSLID